MERVAFLVEPDGERIECLLNPATFTLTRQAGVRPRRSLQGLLTGNAEQDDPLLATGGGRTELQLDLLFDVSKQPQPPGVAANEEDERSVQALTAPLWALAENAEAQGGRMGTPPVVRFVWGKAWNIPAVVVSVAERFEQFTSSGLPQRSWVRLRLLRCAVPPPDPQAALVTEPSGDGSALSDLTVESLPLQEVQGDLGGDDNGDGTTARADLLADRLGVLPGAWRRLCELNRVDDPSRLPVGSRLHVPPPEVLG